jgi:hypothetical protein
MDYFGVKVTEKKTSVTSPVTAETGVMAFGAAPVHQVGGKVNEIVAAYTYAEAVAAVGYSDDWEKYPLCEVIYSHFKLYGVGPLLLVNVMDPEKNKGTETTEEKDLVSGQVKLSGDTIPDTIQVKVEETVYEKGTDYDVFFEDGECIVEVLSGGSIPADVDKLTVVYTKVDFTSESLKDAVIGGYDTATGKSTGIELADRAYFKTKVLPSVLIAPGYSHNTGVAAVLSAKASSLSVVFKSFAVCDLEADSYQEAVSKKDSSGTFQNVKERLCWPMVELDGKKYHLSTQMASIMALYTANNNGVPSEPTSNKTLQADGAILADGTEVDLDLTQANHLRGQGITTALNFVNGWTSWGEYCACAPANTDPKDQFCNVAMMVNYISNTVILSYWSHIDEKMTPRLAASIADGVNYWLNGLVNTTDLLGARCEVLSEENPTTDLMAGIVRVHIYLAAPVPAQQIDFVVEYDESYVAAAFAA